MPSTLIDATVAAVDVPVTLEDAARLGRPLDQRAGARAARRGGRRAARSPCMAAPAASSTPAAPTGPRCARSRQAMSIPVVVNGDITELRATQTRRSPPPAPTPSWSAAARRGGRGSRARSRAISRPAGARRRRRSPPSATSSPQLYDEMLAHHGERIGLKHARKHLGWALDAAAATAGAGEDARKHWRRHVLTAPDRRETRAPARRSLRRLRLEGGRMSRPEPAAPPRRRRRRSGAQRAAASPSSWSGPTPRSPTPTSRPKTSSRCR